MVSTNNNNSHLDDAPINSNIDIEGDNISSKFVPRYDDLDLEQPRYPHVTHLNKGAYLGKFFIMNYTLIR